MSHAHSGNIMLCARESTQSVALMYVLNHPVPAILRKNNIMNPIGASETSRRGTGTRRVLRSWHAACGLLGISRGGHWDDEIHISSRDHVH